MNRIKWPENKKMAVIFSFDVDAESAFANDQKNKNRPSVLSMGTYGRRIGLERILRTLKEYDLLADFFVPGITAEIDPTVIERIIKGGHPIGHHGYFHQRLDVLSPVQEEEELIRGIEVIQEQTGYRPIGYRAPLWEMSNYTPELLKKHGFYFDSTLQADDIPYTIEAGNGEKILEIPGTWLLDDWEQFAFTAEPQVAYGIEDPDKVFRLWKAEFDGLYEEGGCFTLTMHPQLIGRSSRIRMLEKLIQYIMGKENVWFTTCHEVAKLWSKGELIVEHVANLNLEKLFPTK